MSIKNILKNKKGAGLVETILAIGVAVVVITALVSLAVFALRNSRQSSYTSQATQIAQTQLELIRAFRDNSSTTWAQLANDNLSTSLRTYCTSPNDRCYFTPASPTPTLTVGTNTATAPFSYYFNIACISGSCNSSGYGTATLRAYVYVSWSVGGNSQTIYNVTDFTNWRGK